jgi:hypothetical protein
MKQAILNAFGGLDKPYLFKQYIIGVVVCITFGVIASKYGQGLGLYTLLTFAVNTVLYPYSRYLFESLIEMVFGNTRFDKSSGVLIAIKLLSIVFCWSAALFIAPLGLLFIHFRGGKK